MSRLITVAALMCVATSSMAQQADSTRARAGANPRLLPDISAVGDLLADLSPDRSTQEDGTRLGIREVEIALQAAVDPYFRGDIFLGFSDAEGVHIEQAFLTTTSLPGVELRLGRFMMPVGKQNTTHRHDLHTIEYPWVIQRFFGAEGLKGTGLSVSRVFAPFGFYQEILVTAVDRVREAPEDLVTEEPVNTELDGLAYSARLRNYWDLTQASNLELSASAMTGKVEQPFDFGPVPVFNAVASRQSTFGGDATFRWRPLQQGLYRSFIAQAEYFFQRNARNADPAFGGPNRDFSGAYGFARWQMTRRTYVAARYDWLEDPELAGETTTAASGYLQWFPSEFSKLTAAFERVMPSIAGATPTNRILLQASFAIGPHKPHPF